MKLPEKRTRLNPASLILLAALLIALMMFLSGCTTTVSTNNCPPWPKPKKEVERELRAACFPMGENRCPSTFEWAGRLYKLRDQLLECNK